MPTKLIYALAVLLEWLWDVEECQLDVDRERQAGCYPGDEGEALFAEDMAPLYAEQDLVASIGRQLTQCGSRDYGFWCEVVGWEWWD